MPVTDYKEDYQLTDGQMVIKKIINVLLAKKSFNGLSAPLPPPQQSNFYRWLGNYIEFSLCADYVYGL